MSLALNCTQTANSLSAAEPKLRTHWLSVSSYALKVLHSTALKLCTQTANSLSISEFLCTQSFALKLRTHWVQPNSNYELIDYQWVRPHSKFCTQLRLHSNCELIDNQWVRMHSKFCTQLRLHSNFALTECNRTQIANSLIISEFVCTQSFALNYTQKMN